MAMAVDDNYEPIFVARQPIFDEYQTIWGYELLFRKAQDSSTADVIDPDAATSMVIADGLTLALPGMGEDSKILINFPAHLILTDAPLALPKDRCIIEILETVEPTPDILAALRRLKNEGYTLALDDFIGQAGFEPFIQIADIIKVEVLGLTRHEVFELHNKLAPYGKKLLAEKVEDLDTFEYTRDLGFGLFQGYFFSKPEVVPGRKIPAGALAKLQLLQELNNPEVEVKDLTRIISQDLSLSYRLLKFINSAAFSLRNTIQSIQQAITLLGLSAFRQWAMVVLMAEMDATPKGQELSYISVQRAHFLRLLGCEMKTPPLSVESLFLIGLFSKLDALLGQHMEDIIKDMPLDILIKDALNGSENSASQWLALVEAVERGNWEEANAVISQHQLQPSKAAVSYLKASKMATAVVSGENVNS